MIFDADVSTMDDLAALVTEKFSEILTEEQRESVSLILKVNEQEEPYSCQNAGLYCVWLFCRIFFVLEQIVFD